MTTKPRGAARGGKRLGGKPGKGQRSEDKAAYPACTRHHAQAQKYDFDNPRSYFYGWDYKRFAAWEAEQGAKSYARYLAEQDAVGNGTATEEVTRAALRRKGFDPKDFAERWCAAHALGEQLALDLKRDRAPLNTQRWECLVQEKRRRDAAALKRMCPKCKAKPGKQCRMGTLTGLHGVRRA